jgi:CTP synthase (UTP-ammonia lyase)
MTKQIVLVGDRTTAHITHRAYDAVIDQIELQIPGTSLQWLGTDVDGAIEQASQADAVWMVSGTPYRNDDVAYAVIEHARTSGQPLLATCGGFQYVVVEFARNVMGLVKAGHAETAGADDEVVIDKLACSLYGEERMVSTVQGTRLRHICGPDPFVGFHFCGFGVVDNYVHELSAHGLVTSAHADDAGLEGVELPDHPFFIATLFQPQMAALDGGPLHPLVTAFARH